jgi:hypothetical protein
MYVSCLLFHAIRGKTGQVEPEVGKLRGWLLRRWAPRANTSHPFFGGAPQGFQGFGDQMRFRILFLPTENSNPDIMGMYLLSDSWPRFASPSGSCGAEHPVFENPLEKVLFERLRDVGQ